MSNPTYEIVDKGVQVCKDNQCDCVIAIGGGSAIDSAKGIHLLRFNNGSILDYIGKEAAPCKGFITIPTTSGTGSELSQGAIISDANGEKQLLDTYCFENEYTILDPELTYGLPKGQTIMTGLDVFSHAAEAYTAAVMNPITDLLCEKIMETVVEYLPVAVSEPKNAKARERMQMAASLGGWVLICSSDHIGHAVAHQLGDNFHLVHGLACAMTLPVMLEYLYDSCPEKVRGIGRILGVDSLDGLSDEEACKKTADAYRRFRDEVLGLKKAEISVTESDIDRMAAKLLENPFLKMCPKEFDLAMAKSFVRDCVR